MLVGVVFGKEGDRGWRRRYEITAAAPSARQWCRLCPSLGPGWNLSRWIASKWGQIVYENRIGKSFISWKGFSQLTCLNFSIFQFLFDFPLSSMDETLFFSFDSVGNYLWKIDIDFSWWEQVEEFSLCVWHRVCVVFLYISCDDELFYFILFSLWP